MDAVARGVSVRLPEAGLDYVGFVDMSGGSSDDAVMAIAHLDADERVVLDALVDQGQATPFDPNKAVTRFVETLEKYQVRKVTGDKYAGETFVSQFREAGIFYTPCELSKSKLYEALEPRLNGRAVVLLDVAKLEQQLLGLVWRGGRIDHAGSEHDDYCNAVAGVVEMALGRGRRSYTTCDRCHGVGRNNDDEGCRWCAGTGRLRDLGITF